MVDDLLWLTIAPALLAGAALSFLFEYLLQPDVQPFWRRPLAAVFLHTGFWLLLFGAELALFRRPWFAVANVLAIQLILILVNNAKFHFLREPFIFQDFEYFTDALKHPRLFLPFFGLRKAMLAAVGYGAALFIGLTFESSLTGQGATRNFYFVLAVLVVLGLLLFWLGVRKKIPVIFEPGTDLSKLGLIASLWRYGEEEYARCSLPASSSFESAPRAAAGTLPNLVVVQSESFFDVRDVFKGVCPEILREYDLMKKTAACRGKLTVPAWGANTVRTEFAFLSGLNTDKLGVHRFNPYRKFARQEVPTLASYLRSLGYRTVCVHPYPVSFYSRNKVFPLLGFDEFIDIGSFAGVEKTGPYVGDIALAEKVCAMLGDSSTQPIFVFIITMENHGPLHLEKVQGDDVERYYVNAPPDACDDLTIYLRHLRNADRMAGMLRDCLANLPGSGWLCWFGDHVPIMSRVYRAMGVPDGQTDYVIWGKNDPSGDGGRLDIKVENLARLLLEKMNLVGTLPEDAPGSRL